MPRLMAWKSSGPDSGPPTENILVFFVRWAADPFTAIFPLAGLMTAGLTGGWRHGAVVAPHHCDLIPGVLVVKPLTATSTHVRIGS